MLLFPTISLNSPRAPGALMEPEVGLHIEFVATSERTFGLIP